MYGEKSKKLFNQLKQQGILEAKGNIWLNLLNVEVKVSDKSAVGNLIQEWLGEWMIVNDIYCRKNDNSQAFPDFYLSDKNNIDLLEVKTFDYEKSPNFDVAQFEAYMRSLMNQSFKLDSDYLILGYSLVNGTIKIKDIWLKKIWEITCPSDQYALRLQVKQKKIHNIRPYNFKNMSNGFQPFKTRLDFVTAIYETLKAYSHNDIVNPDEWLEKVKTNYLEFSKDQL